MEELGTRRTTERVRVGNSPPTGARAAILPDKPTVRDERGACGNVG